MHRTDLDKLATETMMLREFIVKVLSPDYTSALSKLTHAEQGARFGCVAASGVILLQYTSELYRVTKAKNLLEVEKEQLARKAEALMVDYEQEKQVGLLQMLAFLSL